ncbi:4-carboxy-4-hydroxy-2-oxoadipate aldolase/oxaloacetate decarboxylase [Salinarimonas ramus]|uniref:4-hydroxy-4-methyl-2-oxoglutarate aldolase n=1 Tax=Salinarimonas ramus TaxID=690164 RepID=A0A917V265_9HYPH|nr:4-carboxy-4-hydroxy-2-oxoadipate aldolase/oxaloacetate decarboxylase [Salinarimonas ramus]GGK20466.1 4-carboxy-4-hydroxy-2-oxoadipate aldolase/oxaloacetate decarboxylase [Salinarimonas ramus]
MSGVAVRTIERASPAIIESLGAAGVATVHEAQARTGMLAHAIRPVVPGARVAGSAVTVLVAPGDNWMLHVAIELVQPGDVLVVAPTSPCEDGYFGDILAEFMRLRGGVGAVFDTGVRDATTLRETGFPVWARAISAQGTVKETVGSVNVPVVCAGARVNPGDVVVADDDGVVIVPRQRAEAVAASAQARIEKEDAMRARLRAGETTLDILGLREALAAKGLRYVDGPLPWPDDRAILDGAAPR